jgi:ferredoxin--NADP+ reductase
MSDRLEQFPKLAPSSALTVERISRVHHWNEHLFSFAMTRPASFRFRSGEFVMLGLPGANRPLLRAYSIASPAYAEELEFLSIKVPEGPLTSQLQNVRQIGRASCRERVS